MKKRTNIPTLNWFESNPRAKVGNKYTGSIDAVSINKNAFLYRINFYRKDEGNQLVAEVYDSVSQLDDTVTEYTSKTFEATEEGRAEMIEWLEFQYSEFCSLGKNQLKLHYNK